VRSHLVSFAYRKSCGRPSSIDDQALEWHWALPLVLHLQEIAKTDFKLGHYRSQPFAR
jgi:hypothetical protein